MKSSSIEITTRQTGLLAFLVGATVANIYYVQPLLSMLAGQFHVSAAGIGSVAMLTQLGTAAGMLLFVPLGDTTERRGLALKLLIGSSVSLALAAVAGNLAMLAAASLFIGLTASAVHVLVPLAAHLASPQRRGTVVGTVLSGLLLGILLARTVSGYVAAWIGWRAVYAGASLLMLLLAIALYRGIPQSPPGLHLAWTQLLRSAITLVREQPVLREAASISALLFLAFSAFWTTMVFFLQTPPYHYTTVAAGNFGLVGAAGALAAPLIGRMSDRYGARRNVLAAITITLTSFVVMWLFGTHLGGLIVGVLLLDIGVQSGHVSNQTRIYALLPEARSRLNMVYMVSYFAAGAMGSLLGSQLWQAFGWAGVCCLGLITLTIAGAIYAVHGVSRRELITPGLLPI
jgi:predicted MFS family arabinose efflux permease